MRLRRGNEMKNAIWLLMCFAAFSIVFAGGITLNGTQPSNTIQINSSKIIIPANVPKFRLSNLTIGKVQNATVIPANTIPTKQLKQAIKINYTYGTSVANGMSGGQKYVLYNGAVYNITVKKIIPKASFLISGVADNIKSSNDNVIIHFPVINGNVGLTGGDSFPISVSASANALNNLNYTLNISGNINQKYQGSGNTFLQNFTISIPINGLTNIHLSSSGNQNYTALAPDPVFAPAGILKYFSVNLINNQATATTKNFATNFTFDAGKYQAYEASGMSNLEFFYANGMIVPSWLEGNYFNEEQTSNL